MVSFFEREFESAIEDIQDDFEKADRVAEDFESTIRNWTWDHYEELTDIENDEFEGDVESLVDDVLRHIRSAVDEALDHIGGYRANYFDTESTIEEVARDEIRSRGFAQFLDYLP